MSQEATTTFIAGLGITGFAVLLFNWFVKFVFPFLLGVVVLLGLIWLGTFFFTSSPKKAALACQKTFVIGFDLALKLICIGLMIAYFLSGKGLENLKQIVELILIKFGPIIFCLLWGWLQWHKIESGEPRGIRAWFFYGAMTVFFLSSTLSVFELGLRACGYLCVFLDATVFRLMLPAICTENSIMSRHIGPIRLLLMWPIYCLSLAIVVLPLYYFWELRKRMHLRKIKLSPRLSNMFLSPIMERYKECDENVRNNLVKKAIESHVLKEAYFDLALIITTIGLYFSAP